MKEIDIKHTTKKQLLDIIDEQRGRINRIDEINIKSSSKIASYSDMLSDRDKTIFEIRKNVNVHRIDQIADYKMFQKFIEIFKDDSMTHKEKRYFAGKIQYVFQNSIDKKLNDIQPEFSDELPF